MVQIQIAKETEYKQIVDFFVDNQLEFSKEEPVPTDLVKCWKAEEEGKLVGAVALAMRQGKYIIDGIAVDSRYRKDKIGKKLLDIAINEAKSLGGREMFLVARAPGFFRTAEFEEVEEAEAPTFFECLTCQQYNKTCFPEIMKLNIK